MSPTIIILPQSRPRCCSTLLTSLAKCAATFSPLASQTPRMPLRPLYRIPLRCFNHGPSAEPSKSICVVLALATSTLNNLSSVSASTFARPSLSPPIGFTPGYLSSAHAKSRRTESPPFEPSASVARARACQPDPDRTGGIDERRQHSESPPYWPEVLPLKRPLARHEPESPPFQPRAAAAVSAARTYLSDSSRWTQASARPPFIGPMGRMPPIPTSTLLIEDALTGRACSIKLSQVSSSSMLFL